MCGICGIIELNKRVEADVLQKMCTSLAHRGPDEQNILLLPKNAGLGHTRLSIIDLISGKQPLANEDQTIYIVFNGEIFNYRELTSYLTNKGHVFRTNSDTEVIVHLYEEYGVECVQQLNGQFAFAIWDTRTQTLFLARDRVGIKTIYYLADSEKIIFASELKTILCYPNIPRNVDGKALELYFTYLYIPSPKTIYNGIHKLSPAHYLVWHEGCWEVKQYWHLPDHVPDRYPSFVEANEQLLQHLERAVMRQMVSDVPLGAFLSGGIDSSSVVFFMQKNHTQPVHTFSIRFPGAPEDETSYALQTANAIKTDHKILEVTPDRSQEQIVRLLQQFDEPFGDDSAIPTYFLCKMAREQLKVCLSGDGGDELLGGYTRYSRMHQQSRYAAWPRWLKNCVNLVGVFVPGSKLVKNLRRSTLPCADRYLAEVSYIAQQERKNLFSEELQKNLASQEGGTVEEYITRFFKCNVPAQQHASMLYADFHTYLPEFVLTKVDRMAMMNSLEVRVPFLDHELVEFLFSLPFHYKLDVSGSKLLLKHAMQNNLPPTILNRKKKGFGIPLSYWFRSGFDAFATDIIANKQCVKQGYLRRSLVDRICAKRPLPKRYNRLVWAILVFEIWLTQHNSA
jgi:asparagine synthase (glutamine-hydrolysing)